MKKLGKHRRLGFGVALLAISAFALTGCFKDGIWIVGQQVQPGLYRSMGADSGKQCVYKRLGAEGQLNGEGMAYVGNGPQYLQVFPADSRITSEGCQLWVAAPDNQSARPEGAPYPDGMWRVGVDISTGRYRSAGSTTCEWRKLSNAGHDSAAIISQGTIASGTTFELEVTADTAFFWTRGCMGWHRI